MAPLAPGLAVAQVTHAVSPLLVCGVCSCFHSVRSYGIKGPADDASATTDVDIDPGPVPGSDLTEAYLRPLLTNADVEPTPIFPRASITVAQHCGLKYCLQTATAAGCASWVEGHGPESDDPQLSSLRICKNCRTALRNGKVPARSLVSIDPGTVHDAVARLPRDLQEQVGPLVELTMVESMLLSWTLAQRRMIVCRGVG